MADYGVRPGLKFRALTVKQPWASLVVSGMKRIENRKTRINYRGRLYIHAGKGIADTPWNDAISDAPAGAILGHVTVVDCIQDSDDEFAVPGYFHWVLADAVEFEPIPALGNWDCGACPTTFAPKSSLFSYG